jgi:agmatinase
VTPAHDGSGAGATPLYPFVGIPSFLRARIAERLAPGDADIAVIGVPIDEGQPFMPGARFGPRAIREQSMRFISTGDNLFDPHTGETPLAREVREGRITDLGDVAVLTTDVETTFSRVTAAVAGALEAGALPVILGGDHSITFAVVRAFDGPLTVVQFDAHLDYAEPQGSLRYTNAHAFPHIARLGTVDRIVQVGIRGLRTSRGALERSLADGNEVIGPDAVRERGAEAVLVHIPPRGRCFVTLDMDVLDGSLVPGVVSAEPDGLTYAQLRDTLRALAEHADVVGLDLVEVNPMVDVRSGATAYLAANLLVVLLGAVTAQPGWTQAHPSDG